eukprot:TRINITY_DN92747_c0_g1_i1.p1 TRINITY_DN92747_c0_g1~~TRINITY_DN92747_c0_g1_i1.p1  ORF type:complete len:713 (+),score=131.52 TRINITY_DN92747_c0_g1_i1:211-2349(+)
MSSPDVGCGCATGLGVLASASSAPSSETRGAAGRWRLRVTVLKAERLSHLNFTGDNIWCRCEVLPGNCVSDKAVDSGNNGGSSCSSRRSRALPPQTCCKTTVREKTLDPVWNETFELDLADKSDHLLVTVYNKGVLGSKLQGTVTLSNDQLYPNGFSGDKQLDEGGVATLSLAVEIVPAEEAVEEHQADIERVAEEARKRAADRAAEEVERVQKKQEWEAHGGWDLVETAGLVGLTNIRNTCWMNSVVQSLAQIPPFTAQFLSDHPDTGVTTLREILRTAPAGDELMSESRSCTATGDGVCRSSASPGAHVATPPAAAAHSASAASAAASAGASASCTPASTAQRSPPSPAVALRLKDLLEQLWQEPNSKAISPWRFHMSLTANAPWQVKKAFRAPQDAQEFFTFLLDALHEELQPLVQKEDDCDSDGGGDCPEGLPADADMAQGVPSPHARATSSRSSPNTSSPSLRVSSYGVTVPAKASAGSRRTARESPIQTLFQGEVQSSLNCSECGYASHTQEDCLHISLAVEERGVFDAIKLQQVFDEFASEERLIDDDRWHCEQCAKRVDAVKRIRLRRCPPVLVVHLKRFAYNMQTNKIRKVRTHLRLCEAGDEEIRGDAFAVDLSALCTESEGPLLYDIVSIVNHHGKDAFCGHYTAHCRHCVEGCWYQYDDTRVTKLDPKAVWLPADAYVLCLLRRGWHRPFGPPVAADKSS